MADASLSAIVQDVIDELGLPRLSQIVGNVDPQARRLLALATKQGRDLAAQCDWVELQRLYTFTTTDGVAEYALPDDFDHLIINTVWDRSLLTPVQGPITPATWQTIKSGLIGTGLYYRRFRVMRSASATTKKFTVDPTPGATGEELVFEYLSKDWCVVADASETMDDFENDTDIVLLDRELMRMGLLWRWQKSNGLDFTTSLAEYNERLDVTIARNAPSPGVSMAGPIVSQQFIGYPNIPTTNYGS